MNSVKLFRNHNSPFTTPVHYSVLKLFTGFAETALIAWKLTVNKVMRKVPVKETAKIHQEIVARYSYFKASAWETNFENQGLAIPFRKKCSDMIHSVNGLETAT